MKHSATGYTPEDIGLTLIYGVVLIIIGVYIGISVMHTEARSIVYAAFRDGRAQVIEYAVPGSGKCRAVLIDGERKAEACE